MHFNTLKIISVIALLTFWNNLLYGQVIRAIDFIVSVNEVPRTFPDLINVQDNFILLAHNTTTEPIEFYLLPEVWKDGEKFAWVAPTYRGLSVSILAGESKAINQENLDEMFGMEIYPDNIFPESLRETGALTVLEEGMYEVCVVAYNAKEGQPNIQLSDGHPISCSGMFMVTHDFQPQSLLPTDCVTVTDADANEPIDFHWELPVFDTNLDSETSNYKVILKVIETDNAQQEDVNGTTDFDQLFSSGIPPVLEEEFPISGNSNTAQIEPLSIFTIGSSYAWRVEIQPKDGIEGDPELTNFYSEILTFKYGGNCLGDEEVDIEADEIPNVSYSCEECIIETPLEDSNFETATLPNSFKAGHFEVVVDENNKGTATTNGAVKTFSGAEGIVNIRLPGLDFDIPISVSIDQLVLNNKMEMKSGNIKTKPLEVDQSFFDDTEITLPDGSSVSLESLKSMAPEEYDNYISALEVGDQLLAQVNNLISNQGLALPLGIDQEFGGKEYRLTIDELNFNHNGAFCRATVNFPLPVGLFSESNETRYISFGLNNLCIVPDGTFGPGNLAMQMPLPVFRDLNGYSLFLDGCEDCDNETAEYSGSYLSIGCDGIDGGQIDCRLEFPNQEDVEEGEFYLMPYSANTQEVTNPEGSSNRVSANFRLNLEPHDGNIEWIAEIDVSPFQMSVFPDWGFTINEAMIDLSENINPVPVANSSSIFPEGHNTLDQSVIENWTGLYLKNLAVHLPRSLDAESATSIEIKNGILDFSDAHNFSMKIAAENLNLSVDADGWGLILDEINVSILNKSFENGNIIGGLEAPFLAEGDRFAYRASMLLSEDQNHLNYAFVINTESENEEVRIPLMLADANLNSASHITLNYLPGAEENAFEFKANLIGSLGISPESIDWLGDASETLEGLPLELLGIPFLLKYDITNGFEGTYLGLNTDIESIINSEVAAITSDIESIANTFTFPPPENRDKKMLGINLDFKKAELGGSMTNPELLLEPRLMVMDDGSTSSTQSGFGIDARVIIQAKLEEGKIKYDDFQFECLGLDYQSSAVMVRGSVCYRRDIEEKTKVISGEIVVDVAGLGGGIAAAASYGTKYSDSELTDKEFSFWYAKLAVKINAGIPLGQTGVSIYGLGGGIFYNYKLAEGQSFLAGFGRGSFAPASERTDLYASSGLEMQEGYYGLGLWGLFGPSGEPRGFNFDVALELQMSSNSFSVGIEGNAYTMTPNMWTTQESLREMSPVYGSINGQFSINDISTGESEFLIAADVGVAIPPKGYPGDPIIYTAAHDGSAGLGLAEAFVNSETFYAYVGVPRDYNYNRRYDGETMGPVNLKAKLGNSLEFNSEFYLMLGDGIPTSISLPDEILNLINSSSSDDENSSFAQFTSTNSERPPLPPGMGFAIGGKLQAELDLTVDIDGEFKSGVEGLGIVGYDINLTHSNARLCNGVNPGLDGWYAMGQMYAGLDFNAYILGTRFINLRAVALVQGGLPNPTWFQTYIQLSYDVTMNWYHGSIMNAALSAAEATHLFDMEHESDYHLFGTVTNKGHFSFNYEYGEACLPYVDYANSEESAVRMIQSIHPGDLTEGHDIFDTEIALNLLVPHKQSMQVQIVEQGDLRNITVVPKLNYFKIREGSRVIITKNERDLDSGARELKIQDLYLQANRSYTIEAKMDLYRNGAVYDSEVRTQSFETGDSPSAFTDEYIETTFPEKWHNYFRSGDYQYGYIQFKPQFYDAVFENDYSDHENDNSIGGTAGAFSGIFDNSNTIGLNTSSLPGSSIDGNQSTSPKVESTTGTNNFGVNSTAIGGTNIELPDDVIASSNFGQLRFLIRNRENHSDHLIKKVIYDSDKKQLKFPLAGMQASTKYDLFLQLRNGDLYEDIYTIRFNTSRFNTMVDKLEAIKSKGGTNKTLELTEPFDTYDKKYLDLLYNVNISDYNVLSNRVKDALTSKTTKSLEDATLNKDGKTEILDGSFTPTLSARIEIDFNKVIPSYNVVNHLGAVYQFHIKNMTNKEFSQLSLSARHSSKYRFIRNTEIGFEQENSSLQNYKLVIPASIHLDLEQMLQNGISAISDFTSNHLIDHSNNPWLEKNYGKYKAIIPNQWQHYLEKVQGGTQVLNLLSEIKPMSSEDLSNTIDKNFQIRIKYSDPNSIETISKSPIYNNW